MPQVWNEDPGEAQDTRLPLWYRKAKAKHAAKLQALETAAQLSAPEVTIPDRAPGYHEVGVEYSCVPNPEYPWDPEVFKAIQTLRPDLTPLWVRWIFLTPPEEGPQKPVVFGRHALGRVDKGILQSIPLKVDMPNMPCQGVRFEKPNRIWKIFEGEKNARYSDLPGAFIPFNWEIYQHVASCKDMTAKEIFESVVRKPQEEARRRQEQRMAEREYIQRDLDKFADKMLERMSEVEIKERILGGAAKKTRPSVVVGKHA